MRLILVHGWGEPHTDTYGALLEALVARAGDYRLELNIAHIRHERYFSFHDEVTQDDIARGLERALRKLPGNLVF